ncbi:hypothetical protein FRX31_015707 [Thalictrum thalictroides]|uniref:Uncharacterized protein n=1 Tax=Thalictrum thalictroides TaxID=46969 RepID=A0A7J6WF20_THATH|nr:hypothetical protein FRX31_015707 [Thalictrum thalictroides]
MVKESFFGPLMDINDEGAFEEYMSGSHMQKPFSKPHPNSKPKGLSGQAGPSSFASKKRVWGSFMKKKRTKKNTRMVREVLSSMDLKEKETKPSSTKQVFQPVKILSRFDKMTSSSSADTPCIEQCSVEVMPQADQVGQNSESSLSTPPGFGKKLMNDEVYETDATVPGCIKIQTKEEFMEWIDLFVIPKARTLGVSSHLGTEFIASIFQEVGARAVSEKEKELIGDDTKEQLNYKNSNMVLQGANVPNVD